MTQAISDPRQASAALADLFDTHKRVVFFGGAGVSTASGIPDFRSVDGLYHQQFATRPRLCSRIAFMRHIRPSSSTFTAPR